MPLAFLQPMCKLCEKTVYLVVQDQLRVDGVVYHRACFRCNHCKGTLKVWYQGLECWRTRHLPVEASACFVGHEKNASHVTTVENLHYHKGCFKCAHGGCTISLSNYASLEGRLYYKHHYSQLFKEKGNYSRLTKTPATKPTTSDARVLTLLLSMLCLLRLHEMLATSLLALNACLYFHGFLGFRLSTSSSSSSVARQA